jgi:hypothetical protein
MKPLEESKRKRLAPLALGARIVDILRFSIGHAEELRAWVFAGSAVVQIK